MSYILSSQDVRIIQEPASIGARLLALLIDGSLFGLYYYFIMLCEQNQIFNNWNDLTHFMMFVYIWFYPLVAEVTCSGQTLGKRLMHIRVVDLEGGGPKILSFILRWFMLPFDLFLFVASFSVFFTKRQQRLGDLIAGTWVVRTKTYASEKFSLADYTPGEDYKPVYPKAVNLTPRQATIIAEVLRNINNKEVSKVSSSFIKKLESIVGENREKDICTFLILVLRDYRCSEVGIYLHLPITSFINTASSTHVAQSFVQNSGFGLSGR